MYLLLVSSSMYIFPSHTSISLSSLSFYLSLSVYMYICMYSHINVYIYTYIHTYIYIHVLLIHSFYRAVLLPSGRNLPWGAKFRPLIAEQRAKETPCRPAERLEITAALPFNFALVRLGEHQLALGHITRQLHRKDRSENPTNHDRCRHVVVKVHFPTSTGFGAVSIYM
jgi:hypothetical protein